MQLIRNVKESSEVVFIQFSVSVLGWIEPRGLLRSTVYVTDGNIMYLTDASRFLISCVIQHYAPVVGWGGGGTDA